MNITVSANAKVNLFLDILRKRPDGYHNISSVMHTLDLHDSLDLSLSDKKGIIITSTNPYIPKDERNIAYKAAEKFLSELKEERGVTINIRKRIPIGGGLGGSSTDGAAVLSGLNYLFGKPFSEDSLLTMAASLSADMPFLLKKGAALCQGIGEILTPLPTLSCCFAVIISPKFSLNTKIMYELYDEDKNPFNPSEENIINAIKENSVSSVSSNLYNAFEKPAVKLKPEIASFKERLLKEGAKGVLMSGSGSCVYGLFDKQSEALALSEKLSFEKIRAISSRLI